MKKEKKYRKKSSLIFVITIIVALAGGSIFFYAKGQKQTAQNQSDIIIYSTDSPDESKKNAENYKWKGAPDEPKKIMIPNIGVNAFIQKAGVDQNKRVAVPNNIHLASWFSESQKPGKDGLAVISGHVTGQTSDGIFKQLGSLNKGDLFAIELGNGTTKNYKVIDKVQVKEAESTNYLFSQNPKVKSQVNVITCGGKFNKSANQYEDRIIISGELQ